MAGHTKHFTSLRELLHMVEKNDLRRLLGAVDELYQKEEPDTIALLLCLLSSLCSYFGAYAKAWVGGFSCWFSTTPQMVFSSPWLTAKKELTQHEGTALSWLVQEQMALGKDKSNPLTVDWMLLFHDPALFGVPAGLLIPASFWLLQFGWLLLVLFCSCCWNKDAILELTREDLSRILKLTMSNSRLGEDC
uniref:Uncharacterized protein n=1 Tax=Tanacetum cinerariifolium TaxID=118510 RepID=A0A6L2N0U4_TANCI|nr:hypothetical protein [Tanacetum cinerariifolium]